MGTNVYLTSTEWKALRASQMQKKLKQLKRNMLGFFGTEKVCSLDELANNLVKVNICHSTEDGEKFIREHLYEELRYNPITLKHILIKEVKNAKGQTAYRISAGLNCIYEWINEQQKTMGL